MGSTGFMAGVTSAGFGGGHHLQDVTPGLLPTSTSDGMFSAMFRWGDINANQGSYGLHTLQTAGGSTGKQFYWNMTGGTSGTGAPERIIMVITDGNFTNFYQVIFDTRVLTNSAGDGNWHGITAIQRADGNGIDLWYDGVKYDRFSTGRTENLVGTGTRDDWIDKVFGTGAVDRWAVGGWPAGGPRWNGNISHCGWHNTPLSDLNADILIPRQWALTGI